MRAGLRIETAARALFLALSVLGFVYALLCYIPFTWEQFIASRLYPGWVQLFLKLHPAFFWAALLAGVQALRLNVSGGPRSRRVLIYAAVQAALGLGLFFRPLSGLHNGPAPLLYCLLAWEPLLYWELLLALDAGRRLQWTAPAMPGQEYRTLKAALGSALFVGVVYYADRMLFQVGGLSAASLLACGWSLLAHALAFLFGWALLDLARCAAADLPSASLLESAAASGLLAWAAYLFVKRAAFGALSFRGWPAVLAAAVFAAGITAAVLGRALSLYSARRQQPESAPDLLTAPLRTFFERLPSSAAARAVLLAALAAAPYAAHRLLEGRDWNGLIETLFAVCFWAVSFSLFYSWSSREPFPKHRPAPAWAAALAVIALAWAASLAAPFVAHDLQLNGISLSNALSLQADGDVSYRFARDLFRRRAAEGDLYQYLQRSTNISRETPVSPAEVSLVGSFGPGPAEKPDIFVFVIDSLRRDYLGAYNHGVSFTPEIDKFAANSLVWRNAFTVYGGTGLSEPAIWAGSLLLHKQYVTPFRPMNSLEKLLDHEGYLRLITMDSVLSAILKPSTDLLPLDAHTAGNYLFCDTLSELDGKLGAAAAGGRPLFVYTQPQDIHVSVVDRAGRNNVTGREYPGFNAPVASRLETMDRCFGRFIEGLKRRGLYENSVVLLTADHGDELGENGRWGHAYYIFPEVLRVPLIAHIPARLLKGRVWDLAAPAFNIDIAPTLYALLGQGPLARDPLYGRSLLEPGRVELAKDRKPEQMVVSSYGPVYGVLKDGGRYLYVVDGVNYQNYYFDLKNDPAGKKNLVTPEEAASDDAEIRKTVDRLDKIYRFSP